MFWKRLVACWGCVLALPICAQVPVTPALGGPQMFAGLSITGTVGATYQVLYSTNLQPAGQWVVLTNVTLPANPHAFIDWDSPASPKRYYLAVYNPRPTALVWIPPGSFVMGSAAAEQDREADEGPLTTVTLTNGFFMGKYEVTQSEYQSLTGTNPSAATGDLSRPVEQVSWTEATNYCALLTQADRAAGKIAANRAYRLPTEAEWEYAARAGSTNRFSFGDELTEARIGNYAWFTDNSSGAAHPVGGKIPNAWGLFDLHGNVWEWCADWYASSYVGSSVINPGGPLLGARRVERGGAWNSVSWFCRSANRNNADPSYKDSSLGFRVVLVTVP